jgi:hypothetical protein
MPVAELTPSRFYISLVIFLCLLFIFLGFFLDVPDWLVFGGGYLSIFLIYWLAVTMVIARKHAGKLFFPIPTDKLWPIKMIASLVWIIAGYMQLTLPFSLDPAAHPSSAEASHQMLFTLVIFMHTLQFLIIFLKGNRIFVGPQIGEHGILDKGGTFYAWASIESFVWERAFGRLTFKLKPPLRGKRVSIDNIPFEIRPEIYPYLEQHFYNIQNVPK